MSDSLGDGVSQADDRLQSLVTLSVIGATTLGVDRTWGLDLVSLPVVAIAAAVVGLWTMAWVNRVHRLQEVR
jgi:hypothetical protein